MDNFEGFRDFIMHCPFFLDLTPPIGEKNTQTPNASSWENQAQPKNCQPMHFFENLVGIYGGFPPVARTLRQLLQLATKLHSRRMAGSSSVPPGLARQLAQAMGDGWWVIGVPGLLGKGCFFGVFFGGICMYSKLFVSIRKTYTRKRHQQFFSQILLVHR